MVNVAAINVLGGLGRAPWTQREAVAFEIAQEGVRQAIGYYAQLISQEEVADEPDAAAIAEWREAQQAWAARGRELTPLDAAAVEQLRDDADDLLARPAAEDDDATASEDATGNNPAPVNDEAPRDGETSDGETSDVESFDEDAAEEVSDAGDSGQMSESVEVGESAEVEKPAEVDEPVGVGESVGVDGLGGGDGAGGNHRGMVGSADRGVGNRSWAGDPKADGMIRARIRMARKVVLTGWRRVAAAVAGRLRRRVAAAVARRMRRP